MTLRIIPQATRLAARWIDRPPVRRAIHPNKAYFDTALCYQWIMTLGQPLSLAQQGNSETRRRKVFLVCGFQPLHLATFLQGHFAARFPGEAAEIRMGLYGDLERTLLAAADSEAEAAVVVIEWADLDPRLGLRSAGNWALSAQADIIAGCQKRFD